MSVDFRKTSSKSQDFRENVLIFVQKMVHGVEFSRCYFSSYFFSNCRAHGPRSSSKTQTFSKFSRFRPKPNCVNIAHRFAATYPEHSLFQKGAFLQILGPHIYVLTMLLQAYRPRGRLVQQPCRQFCKTAYSLKRKYTKIFFQLTMPLHYTVLS